MERRYYLVLVMHRLSLYDDESCFWINLCDMLGLVIIVLVLVCRHSGITTEVMEGVKTTVRDIQVS